MAFGPEVQLLTGGWPQFSADAFLAVRPVFGTPVTTTFNQTAYGQKTFRQKVAPRRSLKGFSGSRSAL